MPLNETKSHTGDSGRRRAAAVIDAHIGERIRLRRRLLGISQVTLANRLGITFQQLQKYERGTNRIAASRLHEIAVRLDVEIAYFFGDSAVVEPTGSTTEPPLGDLAFLRAYGRLQDHRSRRALLRLVQAIIHAEAGLHPQAGASASPVPWTS